MWKAVCRESGTYGLGKGESLVKGLLCLVHIINSYNSKISNLLYYLPTGKYNDIISSVSSQNKLLETANVMFVTSNSWDGNMAETNHISTIGNILYTSYNMWLFIASLILLLAMTGAIIITIKQDK